MASGKPPIKGAGITWLAADSDAQMNGYDVEIFDKHAQLGGVHTMGTQGIHLRSPRLL